MSRKPGSMYRRVRGQISTRKEYMGGIPNPRITQFVLGNKKSDFPITVSLIVNEECQVRHNALEAARITSNRTMDKKAGGANYRLIVRSYPHVILRENKQATGAGADRVSQGMRSAFGKIVSVAAKLNKNQVIITIETTEQYMSFAKDALRKAGMKIPSPCKIQIENNT